MSRKKGGSSPLTGPLLLLGGGMLVLGAIVLMSLGPKKASVVDEGQIEVRGQPRLRADPESIDLGEVKLDTPKTFRIALTNVGDEPLRLAEEPYLEVVEGC